MEDRNCEALITLIPAYSVGACTPEETALVEALLPDCPQAIDELTDYLMLADALGDAFSAAPQPVVTPAVPEIKPIQPARVHGQPVHHERRQKAPARTAPAAAPRDRRRTALWIGWAGSVAALTALVLLGAANLYWRGEIQRLERGQEQLLMALQAQEPVDMTLTGDFAHRNLVATGQGQPGTRATVIWNPDTSIGSLYVTGLQPLDNQHNYHVWLVRDGNAVVLGHFSVDQNGDGILLFQSDEPLETYDAIGVNVEPVGGSAEPTTPHLVIGEL